jgi:hypothetical protein
MLVAGFEAAKEEQESAGDKNISAGTGRKPDDKSTVWEGSGRVDQHGGALTDFVLVVISWSRQSSRSKSAGEAQGYR